MIERAHEATEYMRAHLETMRVTHERSDEILDVRTDTPVEVTIGGSIMRCARCGARWRESHTFDPRGAMLRTLVQLPRTSPEDYLDHRLILRRAEQLTEAQQAVSRASETFTRTGDVADSSRIEAASDAFARALDAFYSVDLDDIIDRLRASDHPVIAHAVTILEADPWCFRSGYLKADLMRYLARMDLPEDMRRRLRRVVVKVIARGHRRELRHTRRLARALATPKLVAQLREQRYDENAGPQARWVLMALEAG